MRTVSSGGSLRRPLSEQIGNPSQRNFPRRRRLGASSRLDFSIRINALQGLNLRPVTPVCNTITNSETYSASTCDETQAFGPVIVRRHTEVAVHAEASGVGEGVEGVERGRLTRTRSVEASRVAPPPKPSTHRAICGGFESYPDHQPWTWTVNEVAGSGR